MEQLESENTLKAKTQQRIRYEAQIAVLRKKNGGLEAIRQRLGFSQKQMCELLLVDASAWSRWIKSDENAPGHIYQALDWYLEARENRKDFKPQLPEHNFIENPTSQNSHGLSEEALVNLQNWDLEKNQLLEKLKVSEQVQAGWKLFLILNSIILFYLLLGQYFSF